MTKWKRTSKKRRRAPARTETAPAQVSPPTMRDAQGRVHLQIHEDDSGRTHVTLSSPLFRESWQNELASGAANTALSALESGLTLERVVDVTRTAMAAMSRLSDGLLAQSDARVACKAGCDHCCYQSVGVTTAEALAIVDHLNRTHSSEAMAEVAQRVAEARARTAGLTSAQRYSPDHPCPFLQDAQCTIYEVRPLSCRGMNALDAEECRRNLRDPQARAAFLASGTGGHSFMEPIRAFHAISAGLQLGLAQLYQLDMQPLDLAAAVNELLNGEASLTDEWLAGKPSLAAARGGDSTTDERAHEVSGTLSLRTD